MPDKNQKLKQAIQLSEALKSKKEAFVIMEKLDLLEDRIDSIKPTDLTNLNQKLEDLKNEETIYEIEIV